MKFDYSFTREDYITFLRMLNRKSNLICVFLFTIIYFIAIFDLIKNNFLLVCIFYFVSVAILYSVLTIISLLFAHFMAKRNDKILEYAYGTYHISIDKNGIKEEIENKKFEIKFQEVARISTSKNYFIVHPKNSGIMYIFMKSGFKTVTNYLECKDKILSYIEQVKSGEIEEIEEPEKKESEPLKKQNSVEKKKSIPKNTTKKKSSKKKNTA
jgi:hypothetical protein